MSRWGERGRVRLEKRGDMREGRRVEGVWVYEAPFITLPRFSSYIRDHDSYLFLIPLYAITGLSRYSFFIADFTITASLHSLFHSYFTVTLFFPASL